MVFSKNGYTKEEGTIGLKARRLIELTDAGYTVPPFLIITCEEISRVCNNETNCDYVEILKFVPEILRQLPCDEYAVRSSMKLEDLETSSRAGQFKTILKVAPSDLYKSITSVIRDAHEKLPRGLQDSSIIIQQYIEPDYAGVIFTRNPIEGREMVVEYRQGVGDKVVGGEEVRKIQCLYSDVKHYVHALANIEELANTAYDIERRYDFPQDIEWAKKGETTYILQTRPITSITKSMWQGIVVAEPELTSSHRFYFEKTALSETFARPRPLAFSILKMLHAKGGSVDRAYKNIGVRYSAHEKLFRIFGTELLTDRHIEIQTLFPSLGHKKGNTEAPRWETLRGTGTTLKNIWSLSQLPLKRHIEHERQLMDMENELPPETLSIAESLKLLSDKYEVIFEINIFAQKALSTIERHLGNDSRYLSGLLAVESVANLVSEKTSDIFIGNSLNIDDTSVFASRRVLYKNPIEDVAAENWWQTLPKWKQVGLTPYLNYARKYMELRESARVLSVRLIDKVRHSVEDQGLKLFPDTPSLVYFATIEELISGTIHGYKYKERKMIYEQNLYLVMPAYLASFVKSSKKTKGSIGISPGTATGVFVTKENIETTPGKKILYVEVLSPDLVQYFDNIVGIVSKNGGMLSHLAIMARESRIPVIVTNGNLDIAQGRTAGINGFTGKITFT